jgi:PncC family amidohydrolase
VDPVVAEVAGLLGNGVAGLDDEGPEHAIARQLQRLGWNLGVAESVSGGHLAARLVGVPGASSWFVGGLVVYATPTKVSLAGMEPVSEVTAGALAEGVCDRLRADVGIGVVGVAGPTTQNDQPVGTVCLGLALPGGAVHTRALLLPGRSRAQIQEWAASVALDFARRRLGEAP